MYMLIGELNQVFLPAGGAHTQRMLKELHPEQDYVFAEIPGYGHIDVIIGDRAVDDVWPGILSFLDKYAECSD